MPTTYENRSKAELLELAAEKEIEGRSSMSKEELIAALRGEDAPEPKEEAAPEAAPEPVPHVPPDPIEAHNKARLEFVEEAIEAVDAAIEEDELEDASAMLASRSLFQAMRNQDPFRYLVATAYAAGHGKKPLK
jgi:hypothetical protein